MYVQKLSKLGTIATIHLEFDKISALWLPKTSLFVEILSKSCLNFVQYLSNIYFSKTVPILSKSGIFCRNLFKIWPVPIKQKPTIKIFLTLSKVSSKYVQNQLKISLSTVNMCWKICLKYVIKLSMFCSKCDYNMFKTWSK